MNAIARREVSLAARRRLVRLLFFISLVPPLVLIILLLVRMLAEQTIGHALNFDPVLRFLQVQSGPVTLLALGVGTPMVARDRSEDVLFLYAVRPVLPWHYAVGKMLAVALPAALLMVLPGIVIAGLRLGVTADLSAEQAGLLLGRVALAAALLAIAWAGISVGASAAVKRARWALLLALGVVVVPDAVAGILSSDDPIPVGPKAAVLQLLESLFEGRETGRGWVAAVALLVWGALGFWITTAQVQKEMTP